MYELVCTIHTERLSAAAYSVVNSAVLNSTKLRTGAVTRDTMNSKFLKTSENPIGLQRQRVQSFEHNEVFSFVFNQTHKYDYLGVQLLDSRGAVLKTCHAHKTNNAQVFQAGAKNTTAYGWVCHGIPTVAVPMSKSNILLVKIHCHHMEFGRVAEPWILKLRGKLQGKDYAVSKPVWITPRDTTSLRKPSDQEIIIRYLDEPPHIYQQKHGTLPQ